MTKNSNRWTRFGVAALALAAIVPLTGCDFASGLMMVAKTTATEAVLAGATEAVQGAVNGVIGDVLPDFGG